VRRLMEIPLASFVCFCLLCQLIHYLELLSLIWLSKSFKLAEVILSKKFVEAVLQAESQFWLSCSFLWYVECDCLLGQALLCPTQHPIQLNPLSNKWVEFGTEAAQLAHFNNTNWFCHEYGWQIRLVPQKSQSWFLLGVLYLQTE